MAMPGNPEARLFYRASAERFRDAQLIYTEAARTTAAVYLVGYAVECILKALILSQLPSAARQDMLKEFRGAKAHDYDWLRQQYRAAGGPAFPKGVTQAFVLVEDWGTELRYNPRQISPRDTERFLAAAESILTWADGRL